MRMTLRELAGARMRDGVRRPVNGHECLANGAGGGGRIAMRRKFGSFDVLGRARVHISPDRFRDESLATARRSPNGSSPTAAAGAIASMSLLPAAADADGSCLRGGIGLDWSRNATFTDIDCSSTAPAALYGCGSRDGVPRSPRRDFGRTAALELGAGHAPGGAMRDELLAEHRPVHSFEGQANFLPPDRLQEAAADLPRCPAFWRRSPTFQSAGRAEARRSRLMPKRTRVRCATGSAGPP